MGQRAGPHNAEDCDDYAPAVGVGAAGVGAHAVQDAGNYRMLSDECSYLCGTIKSSQKDDDADSTLEEAEGAEIRQVAARHTAITADAACDLAVMVSSRSNRSVIIQTMNDSVGGKEGGVGGGLSLLLDALACASEPPAQLPNLEAVLWPGRPPEDEAKDKPAWSPLYVPGVKTLGGVGNVSIRQMGSLLQPTRPCDRPAVGRGGRTKTSRKMRRAAFCETVADCGSGGSGTGNPEIPAVAVSIVPGRKSRREKEGPGKHDPVASHALAILSHFLSIDCTKSDQSASACPRAARKLRRRILRHAGTMRAVTRLTLIDPVVQSILADASTVLESQVKTNAVGRDDGEKSQNQFKIGHEESATPGRGGDLGDAKAPCDDDVGGDTASGSDAVSAGELTFGDDSGNKGSNGAVSEVGVKCGGGDAAAARDPTRSGRRKKKRRIMLQRGTADRLEAISENGNAGVAIAAGSGCVRVFDGALEDKTNQAPLEVEERYLHVGGGDVLSSYVLGKRMQLMPAKLARSSDTSPPPENKSKTTEKAAVLRSTTPQTLDFFTDGTPVNNAAKVASSSQEDEADGKVSVKRVRRGGAAALVVPKAALGLEQFQKKILQASKRIVMMDTGKSKGEALYGGGFGEDCSGNGALGCQYCQDRCPGDEGGDASSNARGAAVSSLRPGRLALRALNRIMTGKDCDGDDEGDDTDNADESVEEDEEEDENDSDEGEDTNGGIGAGDGDMSNPLIFTNVMLRGSGSLPLLARAMAETSIAIVRLIDLDDAKLGAIADGELTGGGDDERPPVLESRNGVAGRPSCLICLHHLRERFSELASIIDWACCLSTENRRVLCDGTLNEALDSPNAISRSTGAHSGKRGLLVSALLRLATSIPLEQEMTFPEVAEVMLLAMRTLTSLTHENHLAGSQLLMRYGAVHESKVGKKRLRISQGLRGNSEYSQELTGIAMVFHLLHRTVKLQQWMRRVEGAAARYGAENSCDKAHKSLTHCYDVITFCLNVFTNVLHLQTVASKEARRLMAELFLEEADDVLGIEEKRALSWLAMWVASQTESYRDALMTGSFGERDVKCPGIESPSSRGLEKHEEEYLITAGHGFIVLACMMREAEQGVAVGGQNVDSFMEDKKITLRIRSTVLAEMPKDNNGDAIGVTFIIKTLKAFCNFYHYSVGALSVAVISPVVKLITELEKM